MLGVLVAALTFAPLTAPAPVPLATLKMRHDGHVPAVAVSVHGHGFLADLDTGATGNVLDLGLAARLKLETEGPTTVYGAGGSSVAAYYLAPFTFTVGATSFTTEHTLALDLSGVASDVLPEGGALGYPFFARYVVDLDFPHERVRLYDPATYEHRGKGVAVPLVLRDRDSFVKATLTAGNATRVHLLRIDTGSGDGLSDEIVLQSKKAKERVRGGVGIGRSFVTTGGSVDVVDLGGVKIHDVQTIAGKSRKIGSGALMGFHVVFDYSRAVMYVEPKGR